MKTPHLLPILVFAVLAAGAQAQNPESLFDRAKQARAEGRNEEAEELLNQGKKLEAELRQRAGERERTPRSEPGRPEIDSSHGVGKPKHPDQPHRPHHEPRGEGSGPRSELAAPDSERMRHIQEAIKHLRMAGMHEPAEHLEQLVRRKHSESPRGDRERGDQARHEPMQREMREMQSRLQEINVQMRKMAGALEELREQVRARAEGARDRQ